jgi:hypothetical protein
MKRQPVLRAVVRDVRSFALMLRAIAFTPVSKQGNVNLLMCRHLTIGSLTQLCQVTVSEAGLQVITEVNGVVQGTCYLSPGLFNEYSYHAQQEDIEALDDEFEDAPPSSIFETSLHDLLVCLNIYGNAGISVSGKAKESEEDARRRKELERRAALVGETLKTTMRIIYQRSGSPLVLE